MKYTKKLSWLTIKYSVHLCDYNKDTWYCYFICIFYESNLYNLIIILFEPQIKRKSLISYVLKCTPNPVRPYKKKCYINWLRVFTSTQCASD